MLTYIAHILKLLYDCFIAMITPFIERLIPKHRKKDSIHNIKNISMHRKPNNIIYTPSEQIVEHSEQIVEPSAHWDILNLQCSDEMILNQESKIIISLTTVPDRLVGSNLVKVLLSLFNQTLKPKYVILNVCKKYNKQYNVLPSVIENKISDLKNQFPELIINRPPDHGPATKLLGVLYSDTICMIDDEHRIMVVDDDCPMNKNMLLHFELCYQLYNCDCIFINERDILIWDDTKKYGMDTQNVTNIYYDNYQNFVYGWLGFSFKKRFVTNDLLVILDSLIKEDSRIMYHDDLFFTLYYRSKKLNACGINMIFNDITSNVHDVMKTGLHVEPGAWQTRTDLENIFTKKYGMELTVKNAHNYIVQNSLYTCEHNIPKSIDKRYLLRNLNHIDYDRIDNVHKLHLDLKHFNKNTLIISFTKFTTSDKNTFTLLNKDKTCKIRLKPNEFSNKQSFFLKIPNKYEVWPLCPSVKIFQTYESSTMSPNRFLSISTITSYVPYLEYQFFDVHDRINYIQTTCPRLVKVYNKLKVGAYKADLFRALYGYKNGGVYFDCKQILFTSLIFMFKHKKMLVEDITNGYIYNGSFYIQQNDDLFKKYLIKMIQNIHYSEYSRDRLSITGPGVFADIASDNKKDNFLKNTMMDNEWQDSLIKNDSIAVIKTSYVGYYNENNYQNTTHYAVMWNNKNVFNEYMPTFYSDLIKHIVWINLDRSQTRRQNMEKILSGTNIPNTRICAIDGNLINSNEYNHKNLTKYEIACCMSHMKALNYLSEQDGEYFLVFEDDLDPNNIVLFNCTLDDIINQIPTDMKDFDVLQLGKIYHEPLKETYTLWNNEYNNNIHIASTVAYLITKKGIEKIINKSKMIGIEPNLFLEEADKFLYKYLKTITYKYNFFSYACVSSTIHSDHDSWHKKVLDFQLEYIISDTI